MNFRTIIVDNDPVAPHTLREILTLNTELEVAGEAIFSSEAIIKILLHKPEIVFLDLSITRPDSMEVLKEIWQHYKPCIIFTSAKTRDRCLPKRISCLEKPYTKAQVEAVLELAKNRKPGTIQHGIQDMISMLLGEPAEYLWVDGIRNLLVREESAMWLLPVESIAWFSSEDAGTTLHTNLGKFTIQDHIESLEHQLDRSCMIRTNHSNIININFMTGLEPAGDGGYMVQLSSGQKVKWDRGYRDHVKNSLARVG